MRFLPYTAKCLSLAYKTKVSKLIKNIIKRSVILLYYLIVNFMRYFACDVFKLRP